MDEPKQIPIFEVYRDTEMFLQNMLTLVRQCSGRDNILEIFEQIKCHVSFYTRWMEE